MKILVIGNDAVTHATVWKLAQSPKIEKIYCAKGSKAISEIAECVDISPSEVDKLLAFVIQNDINLTVVCAENAITRGIADLFEINGQQIFAPHQEAAKICTNKVISRKFLYKSGVPVPKFSTFDKEPMAMEYARKAQYPLVIKFENHTSNRSAYVCHSFKDAKSIIEKSFEFLNKNVIFEEYIFSRTGKEISFSIVTDGYNAVPLLATVPYKRTSDSLGALNTRGIGSIAPAPFVDKDLETKIAQKVFFPILDALNAQHMPYSGILTADIIIDDNNNIKVIDLNSYMTNPDAQTILALLQTDLLDIMYSTTIGALGDEYEAFDFEDDRAATVYLNSGSFPAKFTKGYEITGLDDIESEDDVLVFHNETKKNEFGEWATDGGRVVSVTATASTLTKAVEKAFDATELIDFKNKTINKNIGKNLVC